MSTGIEAAALTLLAAGCLTGRVGLHKAREDGGAGACMGDCSRRLNK